MANMCGTTNNISEAVELLQKAGSYADFKKAFGVVSSVKTQCHASIIAYQMRPVVEFCIAQKSFWPREEIAVLISKQWIPSDMYTDLMKCLASKGEVALLYQCLCTAQDVTEEGLVVCLKTFLKSGDDELSKACDEAHMEEDEEMTPPEGSPTLTCPFSQARRMFVNKVLECPCNDVFLQDNLKTMELTETLSLFRYLFYLLATSPGSGLGVVVEGAPQSIHVVNWLCFLLDSHYAQLALSTDARDVLVELHAVVESQVPFYGQLVMLKDILDQMDIKETPGTPLNSTYNIVTIRL